MFRVGRIELEEGIGQFSDQRRVEHRRGVPSSCSRSRAGWWRRRGPCRYRPSWSSPVCPSNGRVEHAGFSLASRDEGDGGVMRAGEATFLKSFSGFRPACCRKKRGIRLPEVDDGAPKAKVLPFRSARDLIAGSAVMNLEVNLDFLALGDGNGSAVGANLGLHEGEATQPGKVDLLCRRAIQPRWRSRKPG